MNILEVKNLRKRFGDTEVLKGIDLTLKKGEVLSIIGSSGGGKTTLLRCLNFLEKADSGNIIGIPNRISAVFQEDCLCEDFSAMSNIRAVIGKKLSKAEIVDSLKKLGLMENDITCPVRELSGGMKRRVAIARALLTDTDLIIMDEPFKGLDEDTRQNVIDFVLKSIQGRTLIVITHSPEEAELLLADKTIKIF